MFGELAGIRLLLLPLFALAAAAIIVGAWWAGHRSILDPGGYRDPWRRFFAGYYSWPFDKFYHTVGALLAVLFGALVLGLELLPVAIIVAAAGLGVEIAERYPRQRDPQLDVELFPLGRQPEDAVERYLAGRARGRFSEKDLVADAIGIAIAAGFVVALR